MALKDIGAVKRNIIKLRDANVPDEEIDQYIAEEGYTPEQILATGKPAQVSPGIPTRMGIFRGVPETVGMIGGGAVGGLLGAAGGGIGAIPGAIAGAGLGAGAGRQIETIIERRPTDYPALGKSIATGAAMEATTPVVGKLLTSVPAKIGLEYAKKPWQIVKHYMQKAITPPIEADILKSLNLSAGQFLKTRNNLKIALPEINKTAKETGIILDSVDNLRQVTELGQDRIMEAFNKIEGASKMTVRLDSVQKAMLEELTPKYIRETGRPGIKSVLEKADFYKNKTLSVNKAIGELRETNRMLDSYYNTNQISREQALKDPAISYRIKEAEELRNVIYRALGNKSRELMKSWGALQDIYEGTLGASKKAFFGGKEAKAPIMRLPFVEKTAKTVGKLPFNIQVKDVLGRETDPDSLIKSAFQRYDNEINLWKNKYLGKPKQTNIYDTLMQSQQTPLTAKIKDIISTKKY